MSRPRPPAIGRLLESPEGRELALRHGHAFAKEALREAAERFRAGEEPPGDDPAAALLAEAGRALSAARPAGPVRVVNATGVLLHTNLGRAPLADAARAAVLEAAGSCSVELDLATGERGKRLEHVRTRIVSLFAPGHANVDAVAVTNNAAALVLALDTLAAGRRVAVSRGELVSIGGDFRVPSIVQKSGATLSEVGTTNRTTLADYEAALDDGAGTILKVHPSNYRIVGFTEEVSIESLGALARRRGVPFVFDAGSAAPESSPFPGDGAPSPLDAIDAGATVACFSADKALGGPQAGIVLGAVDAIAAMTRNPFARVLRPDKLALAALAATLDLYLAGRQSEVPAVAMAAADETTLGRRAEALAEAARAAGFAADVVATEALAGGGAGEGVRLPSRAVALRREGVSADDLLSALRARRVPIIGRIEKSAVLLDVRSVMPKDDEEIREALRVISAR